jgi:alanyl-tRNA synthetase
VLRRIMRRAIRFGEKVGLENLFFHEVCKKVVEEFGEAYPQLVERAATIEEVVRGEEESFRRTLKRGLRLFDGAVATRSSTISSASGSEASSTAAR